MSKSFENMLIYFFKRSKILILYIQYKLIIMKYTNFEALDLLKNYTKMKNANQNYTLLKKELLILRMSKLFPVNTSSYVAYINNLKYFCYSKTHKFRMVLFS